ncbi:MAG: DUF11 domain-containing protein [Caldilinea sp. CFX5]|nr:DUF11 domain-containing protein [Caldilinea sp. CFX5]
MSTQSSLTNRFLFTLLHPQRSRRLLFAVGSALLLLLLGYGAVTWAHQPSPPENAISQIWQRVRTAGAYEFRANLLQDVVPVAGVTNVGQSSERQEVRIEGATNLRDQTLQMTLWSQGGSVLDRASGVEMKAEAGRLLARAPGEEWREISNFTDALIPQGDFTSFLVAATDVRLLDSAQPTQSPSPNSPSTTRYSYRIDGPAFAVYLRDRLRTQMIQRGELTAESQLDLPQYFAEMQGTGELWVGADGLPLRQLVNLQFPPKDGHWIAAKLDVSFVFDPALQTAPVGWQSTVQAALADANHRLWPVLWGSALLLVGGGFTLLVVRWRRSALVYRTLAILCIAAMISGPLVQSAQAATAANRFAARQEREQQLQRDAEALQRASQGNAAMSSAPAAAELLAQLRADRGQNSDGDQLSDVEEAVLGSNPEQSESTRQLEDWLFNSQADPTLDSDGDGLNDREEELLGTDANNPDSDNDAITDSVEIAGFTLGGKQWHTNPTELDSNGDGLSDEEEWRTPTLPGQDTDNDGTPDLFDRDNDNDGVPDNVDISPARRWTTIFSDTNPLQLAVDGLTAGKTALVEFQLRPTNPDHLWYALNKLDWPADSAGNVQDRDNRPDDTDLIPMLEIRIPSAPYNLPLLATPQVAISLTQESTDLGIGIRGNVILTQQGGDLAVQGSLIDQQNRATAGFLYIREGSCDKPGKRLVGPVTLSSNGVVIGNFVQTKLRDRSLGGHIVTVENSGGDPRVIPLNGCGLIPVLPFAGEQMIDQATLAIYGVSVREAAEDRIAKLLYVPLTLRTDDPARLNGNRALPTSQTPRGARVAFSGLMPYVAGTAWTQTHQVRMVWNVQVQTDLPCDRGQPSCPQNLNIPTTIQTYPDDWTLTGLDVRQEEGVNLAIAYEDPSVDVDLREPVPLFELAEGLNNTFMAGRSNNGRRDLTVTEIARRFNRTTNGAVSPEERFGIDNLLVVEEQHYATLDSMARATIDRAQAILQANFSSRWSASTPISPTLLYAYEWQSRALNLDQQGGSDAVQWDATGRQLTVSFRSDNAAPAQTLASLKLQPYRFNGSTWQTYGLAEYWQTLESFYAPDLAAEIAADPGNHLAYGKLRALQLYTFVLGNGLQQVVQLGSKPLIGATKSDKELKTLLSDTGKVSKVILFVPGKVLKAYFNDFQTLSANDQAKIGGKREQFLFLLQKAYLAERGDYAIHVDSSRPSPVGKLVSRIKNLTLANGLLLASVGFTAALVLTQMALSLATIGVKDPKVKSDLAIAVASFTLIVEAYTKIWVPLTKGKFITQASKTTLTKFGLTDKLGSIKCARIMAAVGLVISLGVAWGYFIYAVASGTVKSSVEINTLLAFTIASTIVTLLLFAISAIPIVGQIIGAVIAVVDAILTIVCEAGVKELRGIVAGTQGKGSCFTLSGALTEFLAKNFYAADTIFNFSGVTVPSSQRFPAIRKLGFTLGAPEKGLTAGNTLTAYVDVGGSLPPKVPTDKVFWGGDAYSPSRIKQTRIAASLSSKPITITLQPNVIATDEFKFLDFTQVMTYVQGAEGTLRVTAIDQFPLYAGRLADQRLSEPLGPLPAGINTGIGKALYLNVGMRLPIIHCYLGSLCDAVAVSEREDGLSPSNFSHAILTTTLFTLDVLPATLDGFYARNWGRASGGPIGFATPTDLDGDGLRNAASGGLDPDDSKVDSDGDGLPDPYEFDYRQLGLTNGGGLIDPLSKDGDGDTLCDDLELLLGSNPNRADSDGDTLLDGQEVYHPECANPTVWSGGWRFTYDAVNNQTVRINSDPRAADVDLDGMTDAFELDRHRQNPALYPYNPNVFTPSPIALVTTVDDADNVVRPGATLRYTATVANFLPDTTLVSSGVVTTTFPAALGGAQRHDAFLLSAGQARSFANSLTASGGSLQAEINNTVNAQLFATAGVTLTGAANFNYSQKSVVAIDSDAPQSQLTSPNYVKAGGFYILGGVASDPTSYIKGVDVRIAGQNDFSRATGGEAWTYTWQVPSGDGRYTIESRAIDAVDNVQNPPASRAILVDATPPSLTTDQSNSGYLPTKRNSDLQWLVTLSGAVSDPTIGGDAGSGVKDVEVLVEPRSSDWQKATVNGSSWSLVYPLSRYDANNSLLADVSGQYTVSVRAADNVENRHTPANYLRYTIRLETAPPVARLVSIGDRVTSSGNAVTVTSTSLITQPLVLTGTVNDPGNFASGVQAVEIAFTPAQVVATLGNAAALFYLNDRPGQTFYWDANSATGDSHGSCLNECPTNGAPGIYGSAVQFSGAQVINATTNLSETQLSVSLWFDTSDVNSGLFAAIDSTANVADRTLYLTNGNLCASVRGVQTDEICTAGRNYSDGQWHQAVLVLDENAPFRLYVDGQLGAAAGLVRASTLTTQNAIRLGQGFAPSGEKRLNGRLDEVEIYNASLSAEAVAALYRRWQPVTLSNPGATQSNWSYPLPAGLEGIYQIELRSQDMVGNRNDDRRDLWPQWRGIIDTTAPRVNLNASFSGSGATAQTTYNLTLEDFNLTVEGYTGVCPLAAATYRYDTSAFWQRFGGNTPGLRKVTMTCTVNGFPVSGETVKYASATACDRYGRCTQVTEGRDLLYWATTENASGLSAIRRANLNGGFEREALLENLPRITGLATDEQRGHLYWLERDTSVTGRVRRADLNGQNVTTIPLNPPPALSQVTFPATFDLAVNPPGGKLYWSEENHIRWANLDGSGAATLFTLPTGPDPQPDRIGSLVVDSVNGKIYFGAIDLVTNGGDALAATSHSQIWVINADGSNASVLVNSNSLQNVAVIGLALTQDKSRLYWTQRKRLADRTSSGDGFFSVATSGGAPVAVIPNASVTFISMLEVSPAPANNPNYAYWSVGNTIQQIDLVKTQAGYFADEPSLHLIGASATARLPGLTTTASDLELRRDAYAGVIAVGRVIDYGLTVRNNGPVRAGNIEVVATLPANTSFVTPGSSPTCAPSGPDQIACTLAQLADGAEQKLVIRVQVDAGATPGSTLTTNVTVSHSQSDPQPANNSISFADTQVIAAPPAAPPSNNYLYYGLNNALYRLRTDGSPANERIVGPPTIGNEVVQGVAVDLRNARVYFAARPSGVSGAGYIRRANLDGTGVTTIYTDTTAPWPTYLALDVDNNQLYFTHGGEFGGVSSGDSIKRITLTGGGETTIVSGVTAPLGLALNPVRAELYWSEGGATPRIRRTALNAINPQTVVADVTAYDLTADPGADLLYYRRADSATNDNSVYRVLRDGGSLTALTFGLTFHGPALDLANGQFYWWDGTVVGTIFRYGLAGPFPVTNANATQLYAGTGRPTSQVVFAPAVSRYLYWGVNNSLRRIRANGGGTAETVVTAPTISADEVIEGVAVDSAGGKVYVATRPTGAATAGYIRQLNLNGSGAKTIYTDTVAPYPTYLAFNAASGQLYFTHGGASNGNAIKRINSDGSGETTLIGNLVGVTGLAVNATSNELYWADGSGQLRRATLAGGNPQTIRNQVYAFEINLDVANRLYYRTRNNSSIFAIQPNGSGLATVQSGNAGGGPVVDVGSDALYWIDKSVSGVIYRATLTGSNPTNIGTTGARPTSQLALAFTDGPVVLAAQSAANLVAEGKAQPGLAAPFAQAVCPVDGYEPDETSATATVVNVGNASPNHNLHTAGDVDWFALDLTAGLRYLVSAVAEGSDADTLLELYGSDGTTLLASNDNLAADQLDSQVSFDAPADGRFYVKVQTTSGAGVAACNTNYALRSEVAAAVLLPRLPSAPPAGNTPPVLDSVVLTPTNQTRLESLNQTTVGGAAYAGAAGAGIATLTVTLNGAPFYSVTPGGSITQTTWTQPWTPASEGIYTFRSVVADSSGRVQTQTTPITVFVDLAAPQVTLARTTFTMTHQAPESRQVIVSGTASDSLGLALVEVNAGGTGWQTAMVANGGWQLGVDFADANGGVTPIQVRATDLAGRVTTINANVTVDIGAPLFDRNQVQISNNGTPIASTATITQPNPTLAITWPAATGATRYYVGWTTSPTATLSSLTFYGAPGSHSQAVGDATRVYAHVVAVDGLGNQRVESFGPLAIDSPATPDLIDDLRDLRWQQTGGSQLSADRAVSKGAGATVGLDVPQRFFLSWNGANLRVGWNGADWDQQGDLFVYFDTGSGGATQLYNPYNDGTTIGLPPGMTASHVIWVRDNRSAALLQAGGNGWTPITVLDSSRFATGADVDVDGEVVPSTQLLLPFSLLGINSNTALGVLAVASEGNGLRLWAAAPDMNPLNSAWAINPQAAGRTLNNFALTLYHRWPNLNLGQIPNVTSSHPFADSDLAVTVESLWPSNGAGFLASDLLDLLAFNRPLDGNGDGVIDVALPGATAVQPVGNGLTVQYRIHYANSGPAPARNVTVNLIGRGALNLSNGAVNLGDVAPGAAGVVTVTASIGSGAFAELEARVSDGAHGLYDFWLYHHPVDNAAPTAVVIEPINDFAQPGVQLIGGTVQDASAVPMVELQARFLPGGATTSTTCSDETPNDGAWSCLWDAGALVGVDAVELQARAVDRFGNMSAFSPVVTLGADLTPPQVTLSAQSEAALADGYLNATEANLSGQISDNRNAAAVAICNTVIDPGVGLPACRLVNGAANAANAPWSLALETFDEDGVPLSLSFAGIDGAGNRGEAIIRTFRLDVTPPVITPTATSADQPVIRGLVSDGGQVARVLVRITAPDGSVQRVAAILEGNSWSYTPVLSTAGVYQLIIEAYDGAGNGAVAGPFTRIVDNVPTPTPTPPVPPSTKQIYLPLINR